MRLTLALAFLTTAAVPALGETVSPEVFQGMSEGRTLYFMRDGQEFGAEQYFAGRRVLWRYADGTCAEGRWFPRDGLICFQYDGQDAPQCWDFQGDGDSFSAALIEDGAPTGLLLHMSGADTQPLDCPGPGVGS